jgi:YhcH/YjgK/YiaL family protein
MKREFITRFTFLIILSFIISTSGISAQTDTVRKRSIATDWFNQGEWLNKLKLKPHNSTDQLEFAKQYHANKAAWDKAIAFMSDHNLDSLKTGKYIIDGENVFADVTDNPSSELKDAKWHSHRQYCDIIYVIKGKEKTGIAAIKGAPVIIPFNDKGDSQFYNQDMKGRYYISNPDTFFILLPSDVHRPFIRVEGCSYVKRIRIKIKSISL